METVIIFIASLLLVYLIYYILVIGNEAKVKKFMNSTESRYLKKVYKIHFQKFNQKWLAKRIIMANSFIISITALIAYLAPNIIFMILLSFILLFPIILVSYHVLGKYLQYKEKKHG